VKKTFAKVAASKIDAYLSNLIAVDTTDTHTLDICTRQVCPRELPNPQTGFLNMPDDNKTI